MFHRKIKQTPSVTRHKRHTCGALIRALDSGGKVGRRPICGYCKSLRQPTCKKCN